MDSLFSGSVQSWLVVAAATLSPLIALIVGFEGADWLLRRQLGDRAKTAVQGSRRRDNEVGRPGYADSRNP
jgi:hypothetical protein